MKKILILVLALCLMLSASTTLAEGVSLDRDSLSGDTLVTLTIDRSLDTYTVVIPAEIAINPATQEGQGDVVLKAGFELISCDGLQVIMDAGQPINDGSLWRLENTDNSSKYASASISVKTNSASNFAQIGKVKTTVINVTKDSANTNDHTGTVKFRVMDLPTAGVYTKTVTFSIELN